MTQPDEIAPLPLSSRWSAALEGALDRDPLILSPQTPLSEAIAQLGERCKACGAIVDGGRLLGIFTERDAVRSLSQSGELERMSVARVMTANPHAISIADEADLLGILSSMRQRHLQHVPVVDAERHLVGMLSLRGVQRTIQPVDLLRSYAVRELLRSDGRMGVRTSDSLEVVTRTIAAGTTGSVAVCEPAATESTSSGHRVPSSDIPRASDWPQSSDEAAVGFTVSAAWIPVGIITETDIVRLQQAGCDFATVTAGSVMSAPLVPVKPDDTAWQAHQLMRHHRVRRLVAIDDRGDWQGMLTLSDLLYAIDPVAMQATVTTLQNMLAERTTQLRSANQQLQQRVEERQAAEIALSYLNRDLEKRVADQTTELRETIELLQMEVAERQQAQTQLHRFVRLSQDLICTIGFDEYFKRTNPACASILGYRDTELLALTFHDIVHPDDRALVSRHLETAMVEGETVTFEHRYRDRHDRWGWLAWTISPGFPEGMLYGVARECTEAKRMELALRESAERIHLITDAIPAYIAYVDARQHYRFTNKQHETWLSIPVSDLAGRKMPEVLGDRNYAPMAPYARRALAGEEVAYEAEFVDRQQQVHVLRYVHIPHFGDNGEVEGFFLLAQEITAEKRAEENLRASERKFRVTFDRAFQGISLLRPDGTILDVNQTALDFAGLTLEAVICQPFWEVGWLPEAERDRVREAIARAARGETVRYEMTTVSGAGTPAILDFSLKSVTDDAGAVTLLIAEGRDITESKQAEIDRRNAREKEILLKEIHHRVKNNLQIVSGLLYLQLRHADGQDIEQMLQDSRARLQSMALIHEKLYLSETFDAIDFGEYARSVVQSLVASCVTNA
ncbi:MAG: PAS domain-containing protein, partial [Cyanobacteria bacterium J06639_1]